MFASINQTLLITTLTVTTNPTYGASCNIYTHAVFGWTVRKWLVLQTKFTFSISSRDVSASNLSGSMVLPSQLPYTLVIFASLYLFCTSLQSKNDKWHRSETLFIGHAKMTSPARAPFPVGGAGSWGPPVVQSALSLCWAGAPLCGGWCRAAAPETSHRSAARLPHGPTALRHIRNTISANEQLKQKYCPF